MQLLLRGGSYILLREGNICDDIIMFLDNEGDHSFHKAAIENKEVIPMQK